MKKMRMKQILLSMYIILSIAEQDIKVFLFFC